MREKMISSGINLLKVACFYFVLGIINHAHAEKWASLEWESTYANGEGVGWVQNDQVQSGGKSYVMESKNKKGTFLISPVAYIRVQPDNTVRLKAQIKSEMVIKSEVRIGVQFYSDKFTKIGAVQDVYCGEKHDWMEFRLVAKPPTGAVYMRPVLGVMNGMGEAFFDTVELMVDNENANLLMDGGFEQVCALLSMGWRIPVMVKEKSIEGLVDLVELNANEHLVHYKGGDDLTGLTMQCRYEVLKKAPCLISSGQGYQFWHVFHLSSLKQTEVHSTEKINLSQLGSGECVIPFSKTEISIFDKLSKGPHVVRGHHYFEIKQLTGEFIASTSSIDALISPERSSFGGGFGAVSQFNKNGLFTLANLQDYHLKINDFKSNWSKNGWFVFKIEIKDADGECFPVNRAHVSIEGIFDDTKRTLSAGMVFDEIDVPVGFYEGSFGDQVPSQIVVRVNVRASTPRGIEQKNIEQSYKKNQELALVKPWKLDSVKVPEHEGRGAYVVPLSFLDQDPQKGKAQIETFIRKVKQARMNFLIPLALGNRCEVAYSSEDSRYEKLFSKWDPLQELVREAHREKIQVHPFVCVMPEGCEQLKGVLKEHPDWAMHRGSGGDVGWLDPSVPEVKAHRVSQISEIVKNYEVDGIVLDFCRLGTDPRASRRGAEIYKQKFGLDPREFAKESQEYRDWFIWCGDQLTDMIRQLRESMKNIRPEAKLSAYVQGVRYSGASEYLEHHQHFTEWIKKGYLDMINPTAYIYDMLRFKSWSKRQIDACRQVSSTIPIYVCIGLRVEHGRLNSPEEVVYQINSVRKLGGSGVTFFTWNTLDPWSEEVATKAFSQKTSPFDE